MKHHLKLALIFVMLAALAGIVNGQNLRKEDLKEKDNNILELSKKHQPIGEDIPAMPVGQDIHFINFKKNFLKEQDVEQFVLDVKNFCPDINFTSEDVNSLPGLYINMLNKIITLVKDKELLLKQDVGFTCKDQDEFIKRLNSLRAVQKSLPVDYFMSIRGKACFINSPSLFDYEDTYLKSALTSYFKPSLSIISRDEFNFVFKGEGGEFCKNNDKTYFVSCAALKLFVRLACIAVALEGMKKQDGRIFRTTERISKCYSSITEVIRGFVHRRIRGGAARLPEA